MSNIIVIGAGLAGVEAAWQIANRGVKVTLYEARPKWFSPAHRTENFAELVCSNSLKSEEEGHATAILKEEMRALGSLVMEAADATRLPAGKALAVDREGFSKYITEKVSAHPNIEVVREEVRSINPPSPPFFKGGDFSSLPPLAKGGRGGFDTQRTTIIATGPLTSPSLTEALLIACHSRGSKRESHALSSRDPRLRGDDKQLLYFYDAIAPIVEAESIDMTIAFRQSRYDVGSNEEGDYLNCPMGRDEYYKFIDALLKADKIKPHGFDDIKCFEGCMPIEVMAEGHADSLRHGPMKPMGLTDPRTGQRPFAVIQLRQDNKHATLYNMVGFQTRMTYPAQEVVFRTIPGLAHAKFARLGSMHRNTYINGPMLLDEHLQLKNHKGIYIAGQLTGVEGYLESAAMGLYVGLVCQARGVVIPVRLRRRDLTNTVRGIPDNYLGNDKPPPPTTALGALIAHVAHSDEKNYQPMKVMWGIFAPLEDHPSTRKGPKKNERRRLLIERARADFRRWIGTHVIAPVPLIPPFEKGGRGGIWRAPKQSREPK